MNNGSMAAMMRLMDRICFFEGQWGHVFGWYVEHNGRRVAEIVSPVQSDQFWRKFDVVPLVTDLRYLELLTDDLFWADPGLRYRNRQYPDIQFRFGLVTPDAQGHVFVRGFPDIKPSILEAPILV